MADQNKDDLAAFLQHFYSDTQDTIDRTVYDEEDRELFITPNNLRDEEDDSVEDSLLLDPDLLMPETFFQDLTSSPPVDKSTKTVDDQPKLTAITPIPSSEKGSFLSPVSTPDMTLKCDFIDDSFDDDSLLISAVKNKSYHIRKSVGNANRADSNPVSKVVDSIDCPPGEGNVNIPQNEQPTPVRLFHNKLSLARRRSKLETEPKDTKSDDSSPEIDHEMSSNDPQQTDKNQDKTPPSKSRFKKVSEKDIQSLQLNAKAERTHIQTQWAVNIFKEWLESEGKDSKFEDLPPDELADLLTPFYASVCTKDGKPYSRISLNCIKAGLQRHLIGPPFNRKLNLQTDGEFAPSNAVIKGLIRKQKKQGQDTSLHHPPISTSDICLMYSSGTLSTDNPRGLLFKTFFELAIHFGRRGREGLRDLNKTDIVFLFDDSGLEYATLRHNPSEKNHQGVSNHEEEHLQVMFETGASDCPVKSLKNYIARLHPDCQSLFQRPKNKAYQNNQIWYFKTPLGVNTLGNLMSDISFEANLSRHYTNHSIRATCITTLRNKGVNLNDIKSVTGHRNVASIDAYSKTSDAARRDMSHKLSVAIGKTVCEKKEKNPEKQETEKVNPETPPKKSKNSPSGTPIRPILLTSTPSKSPIQTETPPKKSKNSPSGTPIRPILLTSTPSKSPIQTVKPQPRKTVQFDDIQPENQPSTSVFSVRTDDTKISRKLEFDKVDDPIDDKTKEMKIPEKSGIETESRLKVQPGQTIIIKSGNVIHIHYH